MSAVATVDSAYAFTAASYAIILTRTLLRRLKHERLLPDDYLILSAMIFYAFNTAVYPITAFYGTNLTTKDPKSLSPNELEHGMTTSGYSQAKFPILIYHTVIIGSKWLLIGRPIYMSYLWTLKACILIFYARLTARTTDLLSVKLAAGLLAATWVMNLFTYFFECRPIWLYWQVLPGPPQCAKAVGSVIIFGTTDILTDLVIMIIPLPLIFRAKKPLKTRIQISSIFFLWIFVIVISALTMAIFLEHLDERRQMIWTQLECFFATVAANAPIIHGLWRHGCLHIRQGRFGPEICAPVPEYNLNVRAATAEAEICSQEVPRSSRGSLGLRVSGGIRRSIRKINERIRSSFDDAHIEQSITILQETRTGRIEHRSSEAGPADMFMGPAKTLGHVSTEISCGNPPIKPKHEFARLKMLHGHESR
ncbi:uncharacterized protein LY89DRAFT_731303 [Mollisia scopiformis]|uniref:Rhodopsin domain-containing protein n=1 Tax=Mollisia scopiformis TaxID=149040 RepID=A0A194XIT0_MOLSC|nr:uncharacterized protein LY89DRAFT_731303 [Mollisia scopiformis]KUJ20068.1 hypothetical protein LY89DRAFT_731303 [Mollisia scopiformis]